MTIVELTQIDEVLVNLSFHEISEEILSNPLLLDDFQRYLKLDQFPSKFEGVEPIQIYYSKYYYFLKFLVSYENIIGCDAGIQQQEFRILEEGENYLEIDWKVMENISNIVKCAN